MTEQQFEELLKTLAFLTESKKINWTGDVKNGYGLDLDDTKIRLRTVEGLGVMLHIYNSDGKSVATISNSQLPTTQGAEYFKSSIPNFIWQLIVKQNLRTDETLEKVLDNLRKFSEKPSI